MKYNLKLMGDVNQNLVEPLAGLPVQIVSFRLDTSATDISGHTYRRHPWASPESSSFKPWATLSLYTNQLIQHAARCLALIIPNNDIPLIRHEDFALGS